MLLLLASAHLALFSTGMALGVVIGVFGHIIRSKPLIIAGIAMIGLLSCYFSFVLQPH